MYATLKFDTEDVYFPEESRIDDIPGWLAEIMTRHDVTGTFCTFGEKARNMKDRGREDVLDAMKNHDLVSHQQGNVRPLIPQILEGKGWQDGVEAMEAYEAKVDEDFEYAFGRPAWGLSRHNLYWGPQHVALGGRRGQPYMSGVVDVPDCNQPVWYAGTLNLPNVSTRGFGGFDRIYTCDDAFETRLAELPAFLEKAAQDGMEYVSLFGCHPVQVMAYGWVEEYALHGGKTKSPQELGWRYAVRPREDEARAKANFERLVTFLAEHSDVQMIGTAEAYRLFSSQPEDIRRDELMAYAARVVETKQCELHRTFSPAELLTALAESLQATREASNVPEVVSRHDVMGPVERPTTGLEIDRLTRPEILDLCATLVDTVSSTGHLPGNLQVGDARIGAGQMLLLAARCYLAEAHYDRYETLRVLPAPRYPQPAWQIDAWVQKHIGEHWAYDIDFSCETLAEHARLQTWTLKPAWLTPPRGKLVQGRRAWL